LPVPLTICRCRCSLLASALVGTLLGFVAAAIMFAGADHEYR
jgi:hypothetical protein